MSKEDHAIKCHLVKSLAIILDKIDIFMCKCKKKKNLRRDCEMILSVWGQN